MFYIYNIILLICDYVPVNLINLQYEYYMWIQLLSIKIIKNRYFNVFVIF